MPDSSRPVSVMDELVLNTTNADPIVFKSGDTKYDNALSVLFPCS